MTGVIEIATGNLLRKGHCDFEQDGSFDPETEQLVYDVPEEAIDYFIDDKNYHRHENGKWKKMAVTGSDRAKRQILMDRKRFEKA